MDFTSYILSSIYFYQGTKVTEFHGIQPLAEFLSRPFNKCYLASFSFQPEPSLYGSYIRLLCICVFLFCCLCFIISIAVQPSQLQASLPSQQMQRSSCHHGFSCTALPTVQYSSVWRTSSFM